jgi:DNA-binding beta-propeller fold protein YncE
LAFDASGNLFVSNYGSSVTDTGNIVKILPNGTQSVFASGAPLNGPGNLAFDANGDLFVANSDSTTISKISPGGAITTFASSPLLNGPSGLVIQAVSVPEPSTFAMAALLSLACGGYSLLRRRKKRA